MAQWWLCSLRDGLEATLPARVHPVPRVWQWPGGLFVLLWLLMVSANLWALSLIAFHFSGSLRAIALFPGIPWDSLWTQGCPLWSVPSCTELVALLLCLMSSEESKICFKLILRQTLSFRKGKAEWVFIHQI